ncbi:MAG: FprA family A-type flavoprotein [Clostridiales bacterium]|jgi:flavorubredoxin|nr:FprA family A-type flavoprotein [Clostridiales bacterium]
MKDPQRPVRLFENIHWVGALNPELKRFDVVMETKYGTSYNSYLVQGRQKTALIDTVKRGFFDKSARLIRQLTDFKDIDYIVMQHTEPDHSGSIAELAALAPNARILCGKPASLYLPRIANRDLNITVIKDGDTLDLGGRTLTFIGAPFLHWPDTMFTYDDVSGALFTCDAFGCHYAAENILESKTDETFKEARRYYYDCIVAPFAPHVIKAIEHVNELHLEKISAVLPSHGPALDQDPLGAIALYHEWAREMGPTSGRGVFIGYVSCYGYTRLMAEKLRDCLAQAGAEVDMADFTDITVEEAVRRIHRADVLAIGCPTVNADALPPVWEALAHSSVPLIRGRGAVVFGSYGWSGEAVPMLEQRLAGLSCKVLGSVKARFLPDEAALDEVAALAGKVAAALRL